MTDKKITIWTTKGGCGKTNISAELALQLSYPVITNEQESMLSSIINTDRLLILKPNQEIPDMNCGVIFDFGGYIDQRLEKVLTISDVILVPTLPEISDIQGCINSLQTIQKYNKNIAIIVNKTESSKDFENVESIITKIGTYPLFEIKKSRALPNIYLKKQSIKDMSDESPLERYSYRKILEQFNCLIKYIIT
ncbi:MAG: ParA family protein [Alphaproteobacteria bacterium]|nr:ParA family protein [Alphaproteobacteria bacterium]